MVDPFRLPDDDPSQKPLLNDEIDAFSSPGDPRIGPSYSTLSDPTPRPQRNGLAAAVIVGLALVAVAAVVVAGYFVVQGVGATAESWADDLEDGFDWAEPGEYPTEITDLDALTAEPGERIEGADVTWSTRLMAGEDISPGIYIARDAVSVREDEAGACYWAIENRDFGEPGRFSAYSRVNEGSAIALIPEGYRFDPSPGCGTWEAVDPTTLFGDATGTELGVELSVVGYDVKPGMYLSESQVAQDSTCYVTINKHYGFTGNGNFGESFYGEGGTIRLDVEEGDFVEVRDCPTFQLADPDTAYRADAGATSVGVGTWIVGVDMRPGTYIGVPEATDNADWCWVEVWEGKRDWENAEPVVEASYFVGDDPATFTAELGQWVYAKGCGTWELVEP